MGNENSAPVTYGQRLLNNVSVEWKKIEAANQFSARDGHCAASIDKRLFVFGGVCWDSAANEISETNDTLIFDSENLSWSKAVTSGKIPSPRSSATMAAVGRKLYVFGGISSDSGWLNDLHCLDAETMTWMKISGDGNPPSSRDKLCSIAMGAKILFFGGFGPLTSPDESAQLAQAEFTWYNDLYAFDTDKNVWEKLNPCFAGCPTPRAAHGMCLIDSKLVIFGGRDSSSRKNDLFLLDLESMEWIQRKTAGRQPQPRSFHSVTSVNKRVIVFGGRGIDDNHFNDLHIYDSDTAEWMQPKVTGAVPAARGVHTCSTVGEYLVVFGGSSKFDAQTMQCQEYHNDTHYIHTGQLLMGESKGVDPDDNVQVSSATSDPLPPLEEEDSSEGEDLSDDEQR